MHQLLDGLLQTDLVESVGQGRAQRFTLTRDGLKLLRAASETIARIGEQMLSGVTAQEREQLRGTLIPARKLSSPIETSDCWRAGASWRESHPAQRR